MAFNPFHTFRKHSKVVFAGLTILCMATFVLAGSGGKGDFFSWLTDLFGGGGRSNYVKVYGKNYSAREVDEVNYQRRMANDYMDGVIALARQNLEERLMKSTEQLPQEARSQFEQTMRMRMINLMIGDLQSIPQLYRQADFQSQLASGDKKTELANAWGTLARLLLLDNVLLANRSPGEKFFGMTEHDKLDDTVNFLIWRHQADKMGVRLTDDNISSMIQDETLDEFTATAADSVARGMRERFKAGFSEAALIDALRDEFRVRIARLALTGTNSGVGRHTLTAAPTELTPQESWEMFQDARTTVRLGLIDVPVKDFISQVTATPSDDELKKLFDKYKIDEPAPDRELPGFKEPRKIKVEWVGAGPELPYYQKAADRVLALAPALRLLCDTTPTEALTAPLQLDAELLIQEEAFRALEPKWWQPISTFMPRLHETSVARAENVASLVGQALGSVGTGGSAPLTGPLAMQALALRKDFEVRAKFAASSIGFAANPDPFGVLATPFAVLPTATLAQVRDQLLAKTKTELLAGSRNALSGTPAGLVASDLNTMRGEVMKLFRDKGKDAAEKYVADFVKERGIEHGVTAEARDRYLLGDDPALMPLKDAYRKGNGTRDLLLRQFGPSFFQNQTREADAPDGPFIPHRYVVTGLPDEKQFYWWRTEDLLPRTPKFEKAKPDVIAAWKLNEARALAKKEADRLLEAVKNTPRQASNLRDVAIQAPTRDYFELGPIALYMPQLNPTSAGGLSRTYASVASQPPPTPDQIAQIYSISADRVPYPDVEMVTGLLNLREHPKGATTIVMDKPKQNYYVATLLASDEPTQDEFRRAYQGSMARAAEFDPLLAILRGGKSSEYRKAIVEQLRAEANVVVPDTTKQRTAE